MDKSAGNRNIGAGQSGRMCGARIPSISFTERQLKCCWFAPEFRPKRLRTEQGEEVIVRHPGRWNMEKGPDFLDAVLLAGPSRREIAGDVEIHVQPDDWWRHGHDRDPAYGRVAAHVTYFPGPLPPGVLPPGALQIAMGESLSKNPFFSFEALDMSAFPFAARTAGTPCARALAGWEPSEIVGLLNDEGLRRLRDKAAGLETAALEKDGDGVIYDAIMAALGYKQNRLPFRMLAERVPLESLRASSNLNPSAAYALLAGVSGLLPAPDDSGRDAETRLFVRELWSHWWKMQSTWAAKAMPAGAWTLSGLRPQNHPRRRLMGAAVLFTNALPITALIAGAHSNDPLRWRSRLMDLFTRPTDSYWSRRLSLGGRPARGKIALIGRERAADIIANVVVPFELNLRPGRIEPYAILALLPGAEMNAAVRQAAFNLLGPAHSASLYRNGLAQQGLVGIFRDYCLAGRSRCDTCALARRIVAQQERKSP